MRFLKKRGVRYSIDDEMSEAYSPHERAYIKAVMEEDTKDALVKEHLIVWLLTHHPDVLGFEKSLRDTIATLGATDKIALPAYVMTGSAVSGIFTLTGDFDIASALSFRVSITEPLVARDGSVYHVNNAVTLIVKRTES